MALYDVYQEIKYFIVVTVRNMEWGRFFMRLFIVVLIIAACMGGCSYLNKTLGLNDDHAVEEAIEEKIREETGVNIDLTPRTPEGTMLYPIYQYEMN